jgi:hypothetical protein
MLLLMLNTILLAPELIRPLVVVINMMVKIALSY